jgi:hypothetical protein
MTLRCRETDNQIIARFHTPLRIAHRGLLAGPDHVTENSIERLTANAMSGQQSECDVWFVDGKYWLGHDAPTTPISLEWLCAHREWLLIHAKTPATFHALYQLNQCEGANLHLFYHTDEDLVLTTRGHVIVYPGEPVLTGWISMMPERAPDQPITNAAVICSDFIRY